MDYLRRQNGYADEAKSPRPGLILLDLNMPKMDGREALAEIRSDPDLSPNPPKDTDGRREGSGRGVRELQGK